MRGFQPGHFPDPLRVEDVNGTRNFALLSPFRYQYHAGRPVRAVRPECPPPAPASEAPVPPEIEGEDEADPDTL